MTNQNNVININIQTEIPRIPIKIGELEYSFSLSDENIADFRLKHAQVAKDMEKLSDVGDDADVMEVAKEALRKGYDAVLGDGAFEDLYKQTPSIVYLMEYFQALALGINDALASKNLAPAQDMNRYQRREVERQQKKGKKKKK